MTLTTHVAITGPVPVAKLHEHWNGLLIARTPGWEGGVDAVQWTHELADYYDDGRWEYRNTLGQGLCALSRIEYHPEGWLDRTPEADADGYDFYDGIPSGVRILADLSMDTPYGYDGPNGSCGDLHRALIGDLAPWLEQHRAPWWWYDEGWGDWHPPHELPNLGRRRPW